MGLGYPPVDLHYSQLTETLGHHLSEIIDKVERTNPMLVILNSVGPAAAAGPNDAEAVIGLFNRCGGCAGPC